MKLVDKYHRKMHKNDDDCIINGGDIFDFLTGNKKKANKKKKRF